MKTWISIVEENRWEIENQRAFLTDCDLSCLGKVVYHSENNIVACIQWPQWRNSMAWEQSGVYHFVFGSVVLGGEMGGCWIRGSEGWKCKGSDKCLHLSELTLNHSHPRNQISWRTGSWVKERILRGYFWPLLWRLLLLVYLCMYHNHGDHMFSRLACVKVVNSDIYLGRHGHRSYGLQRRKILRWAMSGMPH